MDTLLIPNILAVGLFAVCTLVSLRSFYTYVRSYNQRLFILGLSMGILALTAAADFLSSNAPNLHLNTDWFLYIGQAISLLFIFLSFLRSSEDYFQNLKRLHLLASVLLVGLLLLSISLPPFSSVVLEATLSGSRCVICFCIFYYYMSAFITKSTRFGFFMSVAFLFLAFGYLMIFQKYFMDDSALIDNIGDGLRLVGLASLLVAVFAVN
jgi:hypothetical protein